MKRNNYYNMGTNAVANTANSMWNNNGNVGGVNEAGFCPDCPTQTIFDPPVVQYENYFHPQLVNVVQNIETIKQHHCCPVYKQHYTFSEKNVMVSSVKRRKNAKAASKKRSKR